MPDRSGVIYTSQTTASDTAGTSGRLLALLISHAQAAVQTVTIYDNTAASGTVLLTIHVAPERSPILLDFAALQGGKRAGLPYSTGLSIAAGNCEVTIWQVKNR